MKRSLFILLILLLATTGIILAQPISTIGGTANSFDTDQDGINDLEDIDDDNDGILDVFELCGEFGQIETFSHLKVVIKTDDNPGQTTFEIEGAPGHIGHGGPYDEAYTEYIHEFELPESGSYGFAIDDSEGNGMTASGNFKVYLNDYLIISGNGNYGYADYTVFEAGDYMRTCFTSDPSNDDDIDGIINYKDEDYCVLNNKGVCITLDTDMDGIPDYLDLDSDGDALPDFVEAQLTIDYKSATGIDSDQDGLDDVFDFDVTGSRSVVASMGIIPQDSDLDGIFDFLDSDSDNDGFPDELETFIVKINIDEDNDGLDDGADLEEGYANPNGIISDPSTLPDEDGDVFTGGDVDYRDGENNQVLTGIGDEISDESNFSVFPNPVSSQGQITIKGLNGNTASMIVISVDGRSVSFANVDQSGLLDLSSMNLSPGAYVIKTMAGTESKSAKFIVYN